MLFVGLFSLAPPTHTRQDVDKNVIGTSKFFGSLRLFEVFSFMFCL